MSEANGHRSHTHKRRHQDRGEDKAMVCPYNNNISLE